MDIKNITTGIYSVVEHGNIFRLVRVIGEYDSFEEADKDITKILDNKKSESEIEDKFKKTMFDYDYDEE